MAHNYYQANMISSGCLLKAVMFSACYSALFTGSARNSLFKHFVRIVRTLKPKWFVMENVTGILTSKTASGENVNDIIKKEFNN